MVTGKFTDQRPKLTHIRKKSVAGRPASQPLYKKEKRAEKRRNRLSLKTWEDSLEKHAFKKRFRRGNLAWSSRERVLSLSKRLRTARRCFRTFVHLGREES